jgi:hypothetical protein
MEKKQEIIIIDELSSGAQSRRSATPSLLDEETQWPTERTPEIICIIDSDEEAETEMTIIDIGHLDSADESLSPWIVSHEEAKKIVEKKELPKKPRSILKKRQSEDTDAFDERRKRLTPIVCSNSIFTKIRKHKDSLELL